MECSESDGKLYNLKVFTGDKWLYGNAAVLYDMSHNYDGYDDFISTISQAAGERAIQIATPVIIREVMRNINRTTVVNKMYE